MSTEEARKQLTALVGKVIRLHQFNPRRRRTRTRLPPPSSHSQEWPDFREILTNTNRIEKVGPPTLPRFVAKEHGATDRATDLVGRDSETSSDALRDLRANTRRAMELKAAKERSKLIWVPDQHG